jgi:GT2 family glycosyltransferase
VALFAGLPADCIPEDRVSDSPVELSIWRFLNVRVAASIVIPTRGRVEELRELLRSTYVQTVPVEILVMDDGDSEAVEEMIRREFPEVRHHRLGFGRGPAFQRNRGIELTSCDIVFPLDDDAVLVSPSTIEQTLAEFDHPRIGAVGMPFVNVRQDRTTHQRAPDTSYIWAAHAFIGAAHAIRRDLFLQLCGYREHFFYIGEEGDLCLRMLANGYVTRLGCADPIHHFESPARDLSLADYCGRRNDILFAWQNVPAPHHVAQVLATTFNGLRFAFRCGRSRNHLRGIVAGYAAIMRRQHIRQPVSASAYRLHRRLKTRGPLRLNDIEAELLALTPVVSGSKP